MCALNMSFEITTYLTKIFSVHFLVNSRDLIRILAIPAILSEPLVF